MLTIRMAAAFAAVTLPLFTYAQKSSTQNVNVVNTSPIPVSGSVSVTGVFPEPRTVLLLDHVTSLPYGGFDTVGEIVDVSAYRHVTVVFVCEGGPYRLNFAVAPGGTTPVYVFDDDIAFTDPTCSSSISPVRSFDVAFDFLALKYRPDTGSATTLGTVRAIVYGRP